MSQPNRQPNPLYMARRRVTAEVAYAGPQMPTPPSSSFSGSIPAHRPRRIRRVEGSSESEAPSSIGDDEIHNEDYRAGGPHLVRLPGLSEPLERRDPLDVTWDEVLRAPVRSILDRYRVDMSSAVPVRRCFNVVSERYDTILILARKHNLASDSWFRACKDILQLFRSKGLMQLNVEILDKRANPRIVTYPISPDDPFVRAWNSIRPQVLSILGRNDWTLLYVIRQRVEDQREGPITVAITVAEESINDWTRIRDEIVQLLDSNGYYGVAVNIRRGDIWNMAQYSHAFLEDRDWDTRAKLGGSLGPQGSRESASTFGGFVDLQSSVSGQWTRYGLTNFHCVVADAKSDKSYNEWVKNGIRPEGCKDLKLDSPALKDHESALAHYQNELDTGRKDLPPNDVVQRILDGDPSIPNSHKVRYRLQKSIVRDIEATIQRATPFGPDQRYLGFVYAASGFTVNPRKQLLDWALIDVDRRRITANEIPANDAVNPKYRAKYVPSAPVMSGTASVDEHDLVFKIGRTTGFTGGRVNGIKLSDLQGWTTNAQGEREYVQGTAVVVGSLNHNIPFGEPGDSGSFVMNSDGQFVGLYIGGDVDNQTGLFIEAQCLFEDIKRVTNCRNVRI
ncbi:hypothetical protein MaudCBS49596_000201 [Microsporum audouinii]